MRIAHLSDLHLLDLQGAIPGRMFNKRITGYVNLRTRRAHVHKPAAVRAAFAAVRAADVDHVVITGDVSNLALEREFELVQSVLDRDLGFSPSDVSLVPGNHDAYTRGAHRENRFAKYFARYLTSDLDVAAEGSRFPFVKLRGPVAIVGLSTALPRPPLVASGALGSAQLDALARILEHPEVKRRTLILLQHHPLDMDRTWRQRAWDGLVDGAAELEVLRRVPYAVLLHGHLHRRVRRRLSTDAGHIEIIGATSASLLHGSGERRAGFNVYTVHEGSVANCVTHTLGGGQELDARVVPYEAPFSVSALEA